MTEEIDVCFFTPEIDFGWQGNMTGGLGVLAGELVQALGEIGVRILGISLLYNKSLFQETGTGRQVLTQRGLGNFRRNLQDKGLLDVEVLGSKEEVRVFKLPIGNANLLLINHPTITDILYTDDLRTRIRQELLLGYGGVETLKKLSLRPAIVHLNEAHCAFAAVAIWRSRAKEDYFEKTKIHFTNHTPIENGLERYNLKSLVAHGISFADLGLDGDLLKYALRDYTLDLTSLSMALADSCNGVSAEHGEILKKMYPHYSSKIIGITNGVSVRRWRMDVSDGASAEEVWSAKKMAKKELLEEVESRTGVLLQDKLTLVMCRRITEYKNQTMLLHRIREICEETDKGGLGIQVIVSGRSHPNDLVGQEMIRSFLALSSDQNLKGKVVFVPNYDTEFAKKAVRGADIWLSCSLPGHEACATGYAKALINGCCVITSGTGGALEHIKEFDQRTEKGNGFLIEPYSEEALFNKLRIASELYYAWLDKRDSKWMKLVLNGWRNVGTVDILNVAKKYRDEVYRPLMKGS